MAALRTDMLRSQQIAMKNHFTATRTLVPKRVWRAGLRAHQPFDPWPDEVGNPVHAGSFTTDDSKR
jgi:hypothetical protein